jgi:hypothetical protein
MVIENRDAAKLASHGMWDVELLAWIENHPNWLSPILISLIDSHNVQEKSNNFIKETNKLITLKLLPPLQANNFTSA